jgi:tetratricopeptide (TPR) repeat protein
MSESNSRGALGRRRLRLLLVAGMALLAGAVLFRNSSWARETRLRSLSVEELALEIHDRPRDPLTFLHYGSALLKAGDERKAEGAFRRVVELDAGLAAGHLGLGSALLHQGRAVEAAAAFEAATHREPRSTAAYLGLAQAYQRVGSPSRALPALERLTQLEPRQGVAWYNLAKLYGDAHQADKGLAAMMRAVELEPDQPDFWRDLGQLSRRYGRLTEAEAQFQRALSLNDKDPITHYWLGQLYSRMGPKYEERCRRHLQAALALDDTIAECHFELGQSFQRDQKWGAAVASYRRCLELDPSQARPLFNLGTCLLQLGDRVEGEKAITGFKALTAAKQEIEGLLNRVKAEPENADLHLRLARAYRRYGNPEDARVHEQVYRRLRNWKGSAGS